MKSKQERAIKSFRGGLNCSQAVLTAYSDDMNLDRDLAERISVGFGGGMGRLQETCGAVTGAFMALGLHYSTKFTDNKERKEASYSAIQKFTKRFEALNGTINCRKLLNADLRTEEGKRLIKEQNLHQTICEKCITDAVGIVDEMTGAYPGN